MTERDKVTVEDIIGIVHTDETTDSVEEVCKLRGRTNERFIVDTAGTLIDMVTRDTFDYVSDVVGLLNGYDKENKYLKQEISQLKHWNKCLAEKRHQELSYHNYTDCKRKKEIEDLLKPKGMNCSDR